MNKTYAFYILDVFTEEPFGGNQLAVFPDASGIPENYMQKLAREINFSESVYVLPPDNPKNSCKLRIFTPAREIPTAGHPTIGAAFLLLNKGYIKPSGDNNQLVFEEKIGDILISYEKVNGSYTMITMNQPLPVFSTPVNETEFIASVLSVEKSTLHTDYPVQAVSCGNNFLFVPVNRLKDMANIRIRTDLLDACKRRFGSAEIYVFTLETADLKSTTHGRMFAPCFGITEDPATGSAAGPLGCYLVEYGISDGRLIICEQGYEMGRKSKLYVHIRKGESGIELVRVSGSAVTVGKGIFEIGI
jgi:trans-2,3-dihydro-3-hydroxyanthranilate isomerase